MIHLDTNIVIALFNGNQLVATKLAENLPEVAISSLVVGELLYGARASQKVQPNLTILYQFLQTVQIAPYDFQCAEMYSQIRVLLRKKGRPTGETDLLIASVALANQAKLITHNLKHFENIDNLVLEDWLNL